MDKVTHNDKYVISSIYCGKCGCNLSYCISRKCPECGFLFDCHNPATYSVIPNVKKAKLFKFIRNFTSKVVFLIAAHLLVLPILLIETLYFDWVFKTEWLASLGGGVRDADTWILSLFGKLSFVVFYLLCLGIVLCLIKLLRRRKSRYSIM